MSDRPPNVALIHLRFSYQSGVQEMEMEEDGVMSISYGVQQTAKAQFSVDGAGLSEPFSFELDVPLGSAGVQDAVGAAQRAARAFLARLAGAEVGTD